jgi:oxalate decarboxylase
MFSFSAPISSGGGHTSFLNNVPDPATSGADLPIFKFELEKSGGRVIDGSYGKEATVEQLPISKGLAGVSMLLQPGVMRELPTTCMSYSPGSYYRRILIYLSEESRVG